MNKIKNIDKYTKITLAIIIIGIIIRFSIASFNAVTGDPCSHLNVARFIAENNSIPLFEPLGWIPFWSPPFFHFVASLVYKMSSFFGGSIAEFSVRFVSPFFGSIMLVYTFFIAKRLFNSKIGLYAVLFLTFLPNHIYLSTMGFPDTAVAALILMSIYYLIKGSIILPAILGGLALMTKYNAPCAMVTFISIIILKNLKDKKKLIKSAIIFILISGSIGLIWYIRNLILLGNPVWPIFSGGDGFDIVNIIRVAPYVRLYLSFFGVPAGYYENLFFMKIPFQSIIILLWLTGTFFFLLPFFIKKTLLQIKRPLKLILLSWFIPYSIFLFLAITFHQINNTNVLARYMMPIFPLIAIIWAMGAEKVLLFLKKKRIIFRLLVSILALIIIGFVFTEFSKAFIIKNSWSFYDPDFKWIKENTDHDSIFLVPFGSCYAYNFNRYTYSYNEITYSRFKPYVRIEDIKYVLVNQENKLYGLSPTEQIKYPQEFLDTLKDKQVVYNNFVTKTKIYQIK